jgi:hypothetical protein
MKSMSSTLRVISTPVFIAGMTEDEVPKKDDKRDSSLWERPLMKILTVPVDV